MAPNGEASVTSYNMGNKPRRLSTEGLQRAMSDLALELRKEAADHGGKFAIAPVLEVEDARCECCGMSEECTPEYIRRVRGAFGGRWICGLCGEAVKEEMEKNGGCNDDALSAHMGVCVRFNKFGRTHPVLFQAEAMKKMLKKARSASSSPREKEEVKKGGIARSSSCIPALMKELNKRTMVI